MYVYFEWIVKKHIHVPLHPWMTLNKSLVNKGPFGVYFYVVVWSYVAMPDLIDVWQGDLILIHWYKYQKMEPPTYLCFSYLYMFCQRKTMQTNVEIVKYDPGT